MMRIFFLVTLLTMSLFAATGELSLYILKNGKPLPRQQVVIFKLPAAPVPEAEKQNTWAKGVQFMTDEQGYLNTALPEGEYQLQLVAVDKGTPQAFVKKNFVIAEGKQSQVILTLKTDDTLLFSDVEAPEEIRAKAADTAAKLEKGTVALTLLSSEDETPVAGARIFVAGMKVDAVSDAKGQVMLDLPEGNRTLSVIHTSFSHQNVKVSVLPSEMVSRTVELSPASMELEEFVVLAPHIEGSVAAVMAEERNSESIANIIGSEQMSKQGDTDAASALKRVAGITVMGGKYIYVRGLGDRYSSTELNGMSLPSPNPVKRTVPLDMFPSGVIGSLQVQKTFTPDITGAFGGGYVNVRTKKSSDDDYVKLKVGMNAHDTFGEEASSYTGSSTDWTGFDHSYRPFSDAFIDSQEIVVGQRTPALNYTDSQMQSMLLKRDINNQSETVPLGGELQMEVGKSYAFGDGHEISVLGTYGYKSGAKVITYTSHDYVTSSDGTQSSTPDNTAVNDSYRKTYQHGGLLNLNYNYKNFDAGYTKLFVLNTLDQTRAVTGTFGENNSDERQSYFEWQERLLSIDQLYAGLDYDLLTTHRFDVGFEYALANEYVPNDVFYDYRRVNEADPYEFMARQSRLTYNHRTTDDELFSVTLKNRSMIPLFSDEDYLEIGMVTESKTREGRRLELTVQNTISDESLTTLPINDIIDYSDGSHLTYDVTSKPKDQYDATLDRNAFYFKGLLKPSDSFDVTFGARYVDLSQAVDQYKIVSNIVTPVTNELTFEKLLPSVGAKITINEQNQIKLAYSETFVYPDFREFVDAEFIHPVFLAKISGNPDLVETDIQSIDARYDYFFNATDSISGSLFYKHMDNPIEDTQEFTTGTLPRYSFENATSADLAGIELSWYKNLGFLHPMIEDITFSGNYTYIDSSVQLSPEQKAKYVTQDRGLQGLSPEVINLSLTYEDADNRSLNLSYNKMSKRLMRVALKNGDVIYALDDYEIPPHLLDFTWIEHFKPAWWDSDLAFTFKVKNLLDSATVWKQGGNETLRYKTGRYYSASLSARF
jgi:hypothetical protein